MCVQNTVCHIPAFGFVKPQLNLEIVLGVYSLISFPFLVSLEIHRLFFYIHALCCACFFGLLGLMLRDLLLLGLWLFLYIFAVLIPGLFHSDGSILWFFFSFLFCFFLFSLQRGREVVD